MRNEQLKSNIIYGEIKFYFCIKSINQIVKIDTDMQEYEIDVS
jgi:hypothetical protein